MIIGGLQKTTLIDFPETIACTVFTAGCNFRCPFCHNKDLVSFNNFKKSQIKVISEKEFFDFLQKRQNFLDGVCITGGEPTIHKDLPKFIKNIKEIGYKVKLDTNGTNPKMLASLYQDKLLDYVAMDLKTNFDNYSEVINTKCQISDIKKCIRLILKSKIDFDFRTTIVPGMHNKSDLISLAKDLVKIAEKNSYKASDVKYFLQNFQPENCLDQSFLKKRPFLVKEVKDILKQMQNILPRARIRGED